MPAAAHPAAQLGQKELYLGDRLPDGNAEPDEVVESIVANGEVFTGGEKVHDAFGLPAEDLAQRRRAGTSIAGAGVDLIPAGIVVLRIPADLPCYGLGV